MQFISDYIAGKHGRKEVKYLHDSLQEILKETYGIAIYQEQILEIAKQFAGFTLGEADLLRRAIGKKIASELADQREKFIQGAVKLGHDEKLAVKMFEEVIEPFAGYGFNKSHAACYALISYQTAYLKAHFPAEFMAALLTADADNTDRVVIEIQECRSMGIEVLPPDVNESLAHFTVATEKTIRFGLTAIKGIGEGPVREIIGARENTEGENTGAFKNLEDFAKRVPAKTLNKKTIHSLAYSGAMDSFGERKQLAESYDEINNYAKNIQSSSADGQTDIFGLLTDLEAPRLKLNEVEPAESSERLRWEKEFMGLYVSGHPLQGLGSHIARKGQLIGSLGRDSLGKRIKISGLISQYRRVITKAGKYMAFGEIEDSSARMAFVLFPRAYDEFGELVEADKVVAFEGKFDHRSGQAQIMVDQVKSLSLENMIKSAKRSESFDENEKIIGVPNLEMPEEKKTSGPAAPFIISLEPDSDPKILHEIKPLLEARKGDREVEIHIPSGQSLKRIKVPFGVKVDNDLKAELKKLTMPAK